MDQVCTIGLDIAKNVFQVHGVDERGAVVLRRQVRRHQVLALFEKLPGCLVGIEACATAHHWAREIAALGHEVRLIARCLHSRLKMSACSSNLQITHAVRLQGENHEIGRKLPIALCAPSRG